MNQVKTAVAENINSILSNQAYIDEMAAKEQMKTRKGNGPALGTNINLYNRGASSMAEW
jgi:hypothetical protein